MSEDIMPIRTLLVTVFEAIIEVFILCLAGYILARTGVTDKATQRKLNVINVSLFTPALLFSKVAFSLTPTKLKEMWIIPLGFAIVTAVSGGVAWLLSKAFKLSRSQTAFAICASMFQNSNSLPIALIQSLVVEVPHLKWGDDDSKDQMLGRALTYMVVYSTLGMMVRWSYGVKLLAHADEVDETPAIAPPAGPLSPITSPRQGTVTLEPESVFHDEGPGRPVSPPLSVLWSAPGSAHSMHPPEIRPDFPPSMRRSNSNQSTHRKPVTRVENGRQFWNLPEQPRKHVDLGDLAEDSSVDEDEDDDEWGDTLTPPTMRRRTAPPLTLTQRWVAAIKNTTAEGFKAFRAFMTVPMYAALLSIFIAMIPPLQQGLSQIKPIEQAIRSAGQCSIPVTLVVLGAFFYTPPQPIAILDEAPRQGNLFNRAFRSFIGGSKGNDGDYKPKTSRSYPGENKTVVVAVLSRMIIVPIVLLPFIALIARFHFFEAAADPVFILSATLIVASPPALTLAQITQAASGDAFERLISKTISWSYAVLTPPLTLVYVVLGLLFGQL